MKKSISIILVLFVSILLIFLFDIKNSTSLNYPKYFPKIEYDLSKNPINKDKIELNTMHNCVFSSTGVVAGVAIGIVIHTAMDTQIGKIQKLVQEGKDSEEKSHRFC
jgi:hypothetical protein